jgi:transcriptional regulator
MYIPAHFAESRPETLAALMGEFPLASLVTLSPRGVEANPVPLIWLPEKRELHGHLARANPLWHEHPQEADVLAVFNGAQAYVSPNYYPSKAENGKAVPTWNYLTVQARGRLEVIDDPAWTREFLTRLTALHEADQPRPWSLGDAPLAYIEANLKAIVGIVIRVTELQGKWKASQNQSAQNRAGVVVGLRERAPAMAEVVAQKSNSL